MSKEPKKEDYVVAGPKLSEDTQLFKRYRTGQEPTIEVGQRIKEGQPINGSAVFLHQRGDSNEFDVEPALSGGDGPPQVATEQYRTNYDRIFGGKQVVGEA